MFTRDIRKFESTIAILAICVLGNSAPARARVFSTPPQDWGTPIRDDLSKCNSSVRAGILIAQQSKQWGPFHFDCEDGTVVRVKVPARSKIVSQWPQFVIQNAGFFGVDSADLSPGPNFGKVRYVVQKFHGMAVVPRFGNAPSANRVVGDDLIIATNFTKTENWIFGSTISSASASRIAEAEWADSVLVDDDNDRLGQATGIIKYVWSKVTSSNARVKESSLVILMDQPVCSGCPFELPAPVWSVTSDKGDGVCEINAVTGEICRPCPMVARPCSL